MDVMFRINPRVLRNVCVEGMLHRRRKQKLVCLNERMYFSGNKQRDLHDNDVFSTSFSLTITTGFRGTCLDA